MKEYHPRDITEGQDHSQEPRDHEALLNQFFTFRESEPTLLTVDFSSALASQPEFSPLPTAEPTPEGTIRFDPDTLYLESGKEIPGISRFFRPTHRNNQVLARRIAPQLIREQAGKEELDLLEIGCYTGRDTMSLSAALSAHGVQPRIHAIDANPFGLEQARQPQDIHLEELRASLKNWHLPEETLQFFETATDGGIQLIQPLRDRITFDKMDIRFQIPAAEAFDVVVANKVLCYYGSEAPHMLDRILDNIHASLRPGGLFTFDDHYARYFELTDKRLSDHGFTPAKNRFGVQDWNQVIFFQKSPTSSNLL